MTKPIIIALDWDGTVTLDPNVWLGIVRLFKAAGHKVYIVTMRYPSEMEGVLSDEWRSLIDGLYCSSRQAKRPFVHAQGLTPNVWIDDNPEAIFKSAVEIWGWCTAEGQTFSENFAVVPNPEPELFMESK